MGQAESQPSEDQDPSLPSPSLPTSRYAPQNATIAQVGLAFHVLRVAERSPADESGVEPFFDFVVGVNGRPLGDDIDLLMRMSQQFEERQISLQLYSTKRKELRDVPIVPSRAWSLNLNRSGSKGGNADGEGGEGGASLLGLSLRLCDPQHALDQVWHVLEILEGSPAQSAGLVPFGDWIIAYSGGILRGEGDFYDVVEAHVDKPLRLFVYNADYDVTRETILIPNRSWGGEGLLGCGVGYGLLHRIPKPQDHARGRSTNDAVVGEGDMPTSHGMAGIGFLSSPPTPQSTISTSLTSPGGRNAHPISPNRYAPPPPRAQANPALMKSIYPSSNGGLQHTQLNMSGGGGGTAHQPQDSVASTTYSDLSPPPSTTRGRETLVETPTIPVPKAFGSEEESGLEDGEDDEEEDAEGEDQVERYDERYGSYATEGVQIIPISHEEDEGEDEGDFSVQAKRMYGAERPEEEERGHELEEEDRGPGDGGGHFMARALAARANAGGGLNVRTEWSNSGRGGQDWRAGKRNERGDGGGDEDEQDQGQGQAYPIPSSPWKPPPSPALRMESTSYV
ncbi:hypothetical protein MVLG_02589 [Microbotryum lychnidis-dioicae p1A1 Lamole]|uniref:PDZ GRASP-type domain-containing protein n=1 Tax=Microbotryum lychnidis-dioicae (strain p1A1 Lamole / MvSl-1064) TaxID=683840 RepID=U5H5M1_USTV1|nr:hypothetical protein MVLG_02589 [Microbotryum lychnidis-dioicae p1A1 Lamole]|eukprot:KDE07189.1 hypothetical protein MVLG_02589 [Microbotryum lychnidis-dioicae p1A1 Lamole]